MKDNYMITIDGRHTADDETESISLSTFGSFVHRDDKDYIIYRETDDAGLSGDVTTVVLEKDRRATITRRGKTNSRLVMEKGQKHMCHYDTGYGSLTIGILADRIDNRLNPRGGEVSLRYALDFNASALSVNELNITVKENPTHA